MTTERSTSGAKGRGAGSAIWSSRSWTLGDLAAAAGARVESAHADVVISSLHYDSRAVSADSLFVAIRGLTVDGHGYVGEAARRGAVAAVVESPTRTAGVIEIVVPDTRVALGAVSHEFYGRPCERMTTHAITGTNGKTTTSYLLDSILREAGHHTGVVGTLGYRIGDRVEDGGMTSPESLDLARLLASMVEEDVSAVTMEVSSHALSLKRTAGAAFDTATFTNLSRDHLDFHETVEEYAAAKRSLFTHLAGAGGKEGATAVINTDDAFGEELAQYVRSTGSLRLVTYGRSDADVHVIETSSTSEGTVATFATPAGSLSANLKLISDFNVMNALAATAVAFSQGVPLTAVGDGLSRVERVEGRLETVGAGQDFAIVVDYAHTPDALEQAIATVRRLVPGRVITVFGCGGDRDQGKRPQMGEIAARGSDVVVVTNDNPRSEDPARIISEIAAGAEAAIGAADASADAGGAELVVIEDRREAIRHAIGMAATGDLVLIAGKGHEDYQIVGDERRHFDDREEARAAVAGLRNRGRDGEGAAD